MEEQNSKLEFSKQTKQNQQYSRIESLLNAYQQSTNIQKRIKIETKQKIAKSSYLLQNGWRKWLHQKGKGYLIDFDQKQRTKLRTFFTTLDKRKCGSIGIDQMEQMLLSLGLAQNIQQVKRLIGNIDEDHSGKIQFQQFLEMIQDDSKQNQKVVNFFRQLIFSQINDKLDNKNLLFIKLNNNNKLFNKSDSQKQLFKNKMSFEMIVNQIKRNHILSSMNIGRCKSNGDLKRKQVVKALQKMEQRRLMRKLRENNVNNSSIESRQKQNKIGMKRTSIFNIKNQN